MTTSLYRFYDADNRLLYVGITSHLPRRLDEHASKSWWARVQIVRVQHFGDPEEARGRERRAIATEWPLYNVTGRGRRQPVTAAVGERQFNRFTEQALREKTGFTVRGLAEEAGLRPRLLRQIERGQHRPSPKEITALATALKVPLDAIWQGAA